MGKIKREDLPEFLGQVIGVFEEFLEERNVAVYNPEREGDGSAILYGSDYGDLQDELTAVLGAWNMREPEGIRCSECVYRYADGDCGMEMCFLDFKDGLCRSGVRR